MSLNSQSTQAKFSPPWLVPRAAYLHIPFCAHKCGYCDFASVAGHDDLADAYLNALQSEISRNLAEKVTVDTVFVGGGTPTRLTASQLEQFCRMVRNHFELSPCYEWTIEANPGTLDKTKLQVLMDHGINRVSLGAQSFSPLALAALERNHNPADVFRCVDMLGRAGVAWSLDLIFAAPGTDLAIWRNDLQTVLSLKPRHLSCYGLIYEKGTALWKQLQAGAVAPVCEDVEATMYEETIETLAAEGLEQYEISNYAVPGAECRHNLVYWANDAYYGFGLGAARYIDGLRATNIRDLPGYIRRIGEGLDVTGPSERLTAEERARETATLMIRRVKSGLNRADFQWRTGFSIDTLAAPAIVKHTAGGLLDDDGALIRLTRQGVMLGDLVAADFLGEG
ncbi:MAG: radical SAM family heme chaperone HemW [bacterium]